MNFSDQWRSLWPIEDVFPAPNLLSGDLTTAFGPLLFRPSPPRRLLLASPSLALRIIPPTSPPLVVEGIRAFFSCPSNDAFLLSAALDSLTADVLSSLTSTDSLSCNNLNALPLRDGYSILLFFPTGDNADEIGFLCVRFKGESLMTDVEVDRDVFRQREGLKHPCHRILKVSVIPAQADSSLPTGNSITEGFLIATTMYSVNWFRVETRVSDDGTERHLLVPLARQGFSSCVLDACWSPHFEEESAVLLETGELCWFNLITKRGGTHSVSLGRGTDSVRWLGCKYGGQPWILLIASSIAVVLIDLRPKRISEEPKVLARIQLPDFLGTVSLDEEKDKFRAFCRADYSDFHFSAVTERLLLLFDTRQPLVPILTWHHGLEHPTYVSMFRLSELRFSEEFKWASESGFAIMVGTFWKNDFKLFCYGPSYREASERSLFCAWELPSSLSLSDRKWHSADKLVKEMMLNEELPNQLEVLRRREGVAGFCIVPNVLLKSKPEPCGFVLIRLMLSGKLEIQGYHASCDSLAEEPMCKRAGMQDSEDLSGCCIHEGIGVISEFYFFNFPYLNEYMYGNLCKALHKSYLKSNDKAMKQESYNDDLTELLSSKLKPSSISISTVIADVSIPVNVFEVASRRVLTTLHSDIQPLAFSKYGELYLGNVKHHFLPLELPTCLPHHRYPPFFGNGPTNRSELLSKTILDKDAIVGPVLPIPVLLALQQIKLGGIDLSSNEELDSDLLSLECKAVLENVFPDISIADSGGFSGWGASQELQDDKTYFVYEPTLRDCRSNFKDTNSKKSLNKEGPPQEDHLSSSYMEPEDNPKDENFETFVCGISDKILHHDCESDEGSSFVNFDFSPVRLDFESLNITLQPTEKNIFKSLKKQAVVWMENNKSYQISVHRQNFQNQFSDFLLEHLNCGYNQPEENLFNYSASFSSWEYMLLMVAIADRIINFKASGKFL